jgi:REP element-mobilizing transposase RayT
MLFSPFEPEADRTEYRRNLPHWNQPGCTYFVTFRLADSLPESVLIPWRKERDQWLKTQGLHSAVDLARLTSDVQREFHRLFSRRMHEFLDAGSGACVLREAELSRIVATSLLFFDGHRCAVGDFVVMPNHVHVLVTPFGSWDLKNLLHSWKRHSAREINQRLRTEGALWMDESFDHAVRSAEQLDFFRKYIRENPVRSRLREGEYALGCGSDVQT